MRILNSSALPSPEPSVPGTCPLRSVARFTASLVTGTMRGIYHTFTPRSRRQSDARLILNLPSNMCTGEEDNAVRIARQARAHRPLFQTRDRGFGEPDRQTIESVGGLDMAAAMMSEFGQEYEDQAETTSPWIRGDVRAAMATRGKSPRSCDRRGGKNEDDYLSEEEKQCIRAEMRPARCESRCRAGGRKGGGG